MNRRKKYANITRVLKGKNIKQLNEIINECQKLISDKRQQLAKMNEHRKQAEEIGKELGLLRSEIFNYKTPGAKVNPKYQSNDDPRLTWTGRGKKPLWFKAHIEAGGSIKDLTI